MRPRGRQRTLCGTGCTLLQPQQACSCGLLHARAAWASVCDAALRTSLGSAGREHTRKCACCRVVLLLLLPLLLLLAAGHDSQAPADLRACVQLSKTRAPREIVTVRVAVRVPR